MSTEPKHPGASTGALAAFGAYIVWGVVPLYWPLLHHSTPLEILAHRIVWSAAIGLILVPLLARRVWRRQLAGARTMRTLALAAVLIAVNWGTYIWAVTHGNVTQAALGYYINPILSIVIGVILLAERLAPVQWFAIGLTTVAVIVLTVDYGAPPWAALTLATSFGIYGVLKKRVRVDAVVSSTTESMLLLVPAVAYLVWLQTRGRGTFLNFGLPYDLLLISSGLVTSVPLLLFSFAAPRIPLSTLGMLQYIAPTLQFLLAWLHFHEHLSPARWVGFFLVWMALMILSGHALHRARSARRTPAPSTPGKGALPPPATG